jgi:hypothetical protein
MTAPTQADCLALLESGGARQLDNGLWEVDGHLYTKSAAMDLAELCLRLGQPLSTVVSARMFLAVVRRLDAVEAALPPPSAPRHWGS